MNGKILTKAVRERCPWLQATYGDVRAVHPGDVTVSCLSVFSRRRMPTLRENCQEKIGQ